MWKSFIKVADFCKTFKRFLLWFKFPKLPHLNDPKTIFSFLKYICPGWPEFLGWFCIWALILSNQSFICHDWLECKINKIQQECVQNISSKWNLHHKFKSPWTYKMFSHIWCVWKCCLDNVFVKTRILGRRPPLILVARFVRTKTKTHTLHHKHTHFVTLSHLRLLI